MKPVIRVENVSKQYRLGEVGTGTISHDLNRWWHKVRGNPDPYLKIGERNDRTQKGNSELVWALKDINFEVKEGEVLGIIGKNGAGKSTLLKILSRITGPTTGRVQVKGRIASLLEVGTGFHPELTGRENVYLNGTILGMRKREVDRKLDEIVDFAGVERYLDTPVKRYSSGMMVRLGFAVAAHLDPEILIVDEVLAVGDAEFQKKCLGKMKDVSTNQGRTVLFVSHNMAAVENLCEKCALMEKGTIVQLDDSVHVLMYYTKVTNLNLNLNSFNFDFFDIYFKVLNDKNEEALIFKSGEQINFNVFFSPKKVFVLIDITIAIFNHIGQRILTFDTRYQIANDKKIDSSTLFEFIWKKNILTPGSYIIGFGVYENRIYLDSVESAFSISIVESDYYSTGKLPDSGQGHILTDGEWKIINL